MGGHSFNLHSEYQPAGDQPEAIEALVRGLDDGRRFQVLEGVTGSGKTFTIANVIARTNLPTLVVSHNKTLAAQLYGELKEFFPRNAVEYFVSYYDYYQPEAYIPQTDTHIEKDASINEHIERLRLSATNSVMTRNDVIVVASVSCIYGLGSPEDYREMTVFLQVGGEVNRDEMLRKLVAIQYDRNDYEAMPGTFRVRGDSVEVFPSYSDRRIRVEFFGDEISALKETDVVSGAVVAALDRAMISPAKHFVMPEARVKTAIGRILAEVKERVAWFEREGKLLEAQRISMRTMFDVEMLREMGYCSGIENYSRHLSGRAEGQPPATLLDYFAKPFLTIVDESHATVPQLKAMLHGDRSRKQTLVDYGFRLPSARDNRPLGFDEFLETVQQVIFMSATPGPFELQAAPEPVRQLVRPTGLVDPPVIVRPLSGQVDDLMEEVRAHAARKERVLVTTLTKKTAEDLSEYFRNVGLRVQYLHSEVDTLDRVEILHALRKADFDCLVGVNLLREGLDLPEVSLVAVLDADKEGFLRSETSLLQTAGRAARHSEGKVILYADNITDSMRRMIDTTEFRRKKQIRHNKDHNVTPRTIRKEIRHLLVIQKDARDLDASIVKESGVEYDVHNALEELRKEMIEAADSLEYERAAMLRDEIREIERAEKGAAESTAGAHEDMPGRHSKPRGVRGSYPRTVKRRR